MEKIKKITLKLLPVLIICMMVLVSFNGVFANSVVDNVISSGAGNGIGDVDSAVTRIWSTVLTILQILAVAAIVVAGVRYMFASADEKADIKKGLGMLVVGAILVFAASTVVQFIVSAAGQVTGSAS